MGIVDVGSMAEFDALLSRAGPRVVVVDFFATWCGPCRAVAPQVEQLSRKYADVGLFAKVDVDRAKDVARHCAVRAMPTFHVYSKGRRVEEVVGANIGRVESAIQSYAPRTVAFEGAGRRLGGATTQASPDSGANMVQPSKPKALVAKERPSRAPAKKPVEPDQALLQQLLELGFGKAHSEAALTATGNESLGSAVDHLASITDQDNEVESTDVKPRGTPDSASLSGKLLLRMPDGINMELPVNASDSIGKVWEEIAEQRPEVARQGFKLLSQYPRKTYTQEDSTRLLGEEQLVPRGQLKVELI
uniref:Thioredoxin n=1 Tax=Rhodosorus marinus TaxID=101924 RepID=A0A7S0BKE1_9RHOD|mmetsp:Transcript_20434/g.29652  ORF Transcript_20434/g.29652 Transcript_20434/m.29652 type:complete len:304 (+) Transcript_20434:208-1119(+)